MKINNEILCDFIYCQYQAFLKTQQQKGKLSDYQIFYNQRKEIQKQSFETSLSNHKNRFDQKEVSLNFQCSTDHIDLVLDAVEFTTDHKMVPVFITPFETVTKQDRALIALQSYYVQKEGQTIVENCKVIYGKLLKQIKLKCLLSSKEIKKSVVELNKILIDSVEPALILNSHCTICEYHDHCMKKAKTEDHISLLDRATPKIIEKYKKRGIFTIQQLSYLYKPQKRKKQRNKSVFSHNIEIQALAIRMNKILVQVLPAIERQEVELFMDIEGNPDHKSYYLIGVMVLNQGEVTRYSFWAEKELDEIRIWQQFLDCISQYPDAPVYHYGHYDAKAVEIMGKRYKTDIHPIQNRLINISHSIFGKIYFPVYSNRLKTLGVYIGASWSSNMATGIQSLIWRYEWEHTGNEQTKQLLITYNFEDCYALKLLTDKLIGIRESATHLSDIDFVINPKKNSSLVSSQIHHQFDQLLRFAHENYDAKKISFQEKEMVAEEMDDISPKKIGSKLGHKGAMRSVPKAKKIIELPARNFCPIHQCELSESIRKVEKTITDLVFTKNAIRKTVVKYVGNKSYCSLCKKHYVPTQLQEFGTNHIGNHLKIWVVYQRLFLRLPLDIIRLNLIEMFDEKISVGTICNIFKTIANLYQHTEACHLNQILNSPFVHVDETQINVKGMNHYVWIFTNGKQVFFKETESREIDMVAKLLNDFTGILISDFYPGYDSLKCRHQKCWVHLIRDMNDDLWKNSYNNEYESFVLNLKNLIIPIFASIEKYGSKKYHFNKFKKQIDQFYHHYLEEGVYHSEITLKYQIRLKKNWKNLFAFTEYDNIPWNNNMAERGIRHLAVQRKISTYFDKGIANYLLLLGIMQTCKFQNKSFLQFLLSGKKML